ncbi:EpsG family protein [Aliidiomarina haloalkalitolerans]|uniref:EpsG family protein n=1 Tax=Aliidiomarina haloalkalitolerans TaxID=859059 RepID=A0A432VQZ2_9GAMM|nr:EpsG family protein [Aliidiomarina haloalkalitolerans]RUO18678.1 hypothetical protein CWE06_10570 [Aliidiomarina haloalkalitolerans]
MIFISFFTIAAIFTCIQSLLPNTTAALNKFVFSIFSILLIIVVGFRYDSIDYYAYIDIFHRVSFSEFGFPFYRSVGDTTGNEFIFATVVSIIKALGLNHTTLFVVVATFSIGIKFYLYSRLQYFWLGCLLFMSFIFFKELSQIRSMLAGSFVMLALFLYSSSKGRAGTMLLLSSGLIQVFSFSSLFFIFIKKIITPGLFLVIIGLSFAVAIAYGGIGNLLIYASTFFGASVSNKVIGYYYGAFNYESISLNYFNLTSLFFALYFLIYRMKLGFESSLQDILIYALAFGVSMYFLFFDFNTVASRFSDLFIMLSLSFLIPLHLEYQKGLVYRHIVIFGMVIYSSVLFWFNFSNTPAYSSVLVS